ncbi:MAG: O-antigen ligase family protein [Candidatus Spechtbacteria bacterium]|nr:O-antigen ligase family protein [Candidatus Spechtbacteria bacterium]
MQTFTILIILFFSAVALYKRQWGLYLFVFLLPLYIFRIDVQVFNTGRMVALSISEILFYILTIIVLIRDWREAGRKMRELIIREKLLLLGILYLLSGVFVGVWQSNNALQTVGILRGWIIAPTALFFISIIIRANKEYIARALAVSASFVAAASFFAPHAFNADVRLQGFLGSPNYLAMYLAPLLPFILYEIFKCIRDKKPFITSAFWVAGCAVTTTAIFFSFSQGAWLGIVAALVVAALWYAKKRFSTNAIIIAMFFIILFSEFIGQSFLQDSIASSLKSRAGLWEAAWNIGVSHPLFGIGAGMFPEAYKIQKHIVLYPTSMETALHPHNIFLSFWLYGGLLGMLGFGIILIWLAKKLYIRLLEKEKNSAMLYGAVAAAFIIILVHGLVDTTYWKNDLAFMWWILLAMV